MWILMDEFTNLARYPLPLDASLVRSVVAEKDSYVLRIPLIPDLATLWPGARVQVLPNKGHVEAYFTHHKQFQQSIIDVLHDMENYDDINQTTQEKRIKPQSDLRQDNIVCK